jgi:hypothetical protein
MNREFLGWDAPPQERASAWLAERFGADMRGVLVALPGARSGRILGESLARRIGSQLRPPDVVTAGLASDALLAVEGTPAGRLVRTLAWKQALAGLGADALSRVVARPPGREDLAGWMRLAEEVRGLFGEVAAEGLGFADVAANELLAPLDGEQRRWRALAEAQARMVDLLADAGFVDPHLGRLHAIRASATRPVREVVLVGVSEMNQLLRSALDLTKAPVTALVFAPAERADCFDAQGALIPEAWQSWETSLDAEAQWHVVDGPAEQARRAAGVIAGWDGRYAAEQISIGLADREVAPYLQGVMAECGVTARDAAGTPIERTRPAVLLGAVARFLDGRRHADLAKLVRHPDFEAALRRVDGSLEPVDLVDRYHNAHLPWKADGRWLADPDDSNDKYLAASMRRLWGGVRDLLGGLLDEGEHQAGAVFPKIRQLLQAVYGDRDLDPAVESDRLLIASLARLGEALADLESLPAPLAPAGRADATLSLLLRAIGGDGVAPAPARPGEPTIEMLGWLELALDDAAALVVTGFEDGRVPESIHGDAYLPNRLRQSLGIVDNQKRMARDLYATELLLRSRERVAFISGRRSAAGDPQVPSRIVFHCAESEVVPRVKRFLAGSTQARPRVGGSAGSSRDLPRLAEEPVIEKIRVTAFKTYLQSPYLYYLEHVAKLETLDDRALELDPLGFGSLAHDVLHRFGRDDPMRDECDEAKLSQFLTDTVHALGRERYGRHPLPAVQLQLEQLAQRLRGFAAAQAKRRAEGWEIRETEWSPSEDSPPFDVDGSPIRLTGRIDRIDHHPETGRWAIWDYKTGEKVDKPLNAHRKMSGEWVDLQLPLYCSLAVELIGDAVPAEVGYIALPREEKEIGFRGINRWARRTGDEETFEEGMESALEAARDVVRRIRRGEFFTDEGFAPRDEIFSAVGGVGILTEDEDE